HPFAEDQKLLEAERLAELGTGLPADKDRLDAREVAFQVVGIAAKEDFADHRAQDRVAQEFQPLVGGETMLGPRGMRQGRFQQCQIAKSITDPLLAPLKLRQITWRALLRRARRGVGHEYERTKQRQPSRREAANRMPR